MGVCSVYTCLRLKFPYGNEMKLSIGERLQVLKHKQRVT